MGLARSHNGHKSQGSGLHRPHTLAHRQLSMDLLLNTDTGGDLGYILYLHYDKFSGWQASPVFKMRCISF